MGRAVFKLNGNCPMIAPQNLETAWPLPIKWDLNIHQNIYVCVYNAHI